MPPTLDDSPSEPLGPPDQLPGCYASAAVLSAGFQQEYLWSADEDEDEGEDEAPVPDHVFVLAEGFESGGVALFLDVQESRVIEETIRYQTCGEDLKKYFEDLKQKYRNLELIPCPGRGMMDSGGVDAEKMGAALSEEEVLRQTEPLWGTDLDIQYTRQLYRAFGGRMIFAGTRRFVKSKI